MSLEQWSRFMEGKVSKSIGKYTFVVVLIRWHWQSKGLMSTYILSWYNNPALNSRFYSEDEAGNSDLVLRLLQSPLQNQSMLTANPQCFISEFMNAGQEVGLPMLSATVMYQMSKLSAIFSTLVCNEMCVARYLKINKKEIHEVALLELVAG